MDKDNGALREEELAAHHVVLQPKELTEAWELKQKYGSKAIFIAGGTLIQLQREQGIQLPRYLISLEGINRLKGAAAIKDGGFAIGSLMTIADCMLEPIISNNWEVLTKAAKGVGSPSIRNRATIGGNIVYGVGDMIPALLVLDAEMSILDDQGFQELSIWHFINNRKNFTSFILASVMLPSLPLIEKEMRFYRKVGRREAFIPSVVTVSGRCSAEADGRIVDIRLAAGGGASVPQRLVQCERKLEGAILNHDTLKKLHLDICEEYTPTPDAFASVHYRKMAAANVIVSELEQFITDGGINDGP